MSIGKINEVDYGPLEVLVGTWVGNKGKDRSPEPGNIEENDYSERLTIEKAADVTNGEEEQLSILRYHQSVNRNRDGKIIHDQVGYWLWKPGTNEIIQSVAIPRGVSLLAHGTVSESDGNFTFQAKAEAQGEWSIVESPFMKEKATTKAYQIRIEVSGSCLKYTQTTLVDIYEKKNFEHTDENELIKEI